MITKQDTNYRAFKLDDFDYLNQFCTHYTIDDTAILSMHFKNPKTQGFLVHLFELGNPATPIHHLTDKDRSFALAFDSFYPPMIHCPASDEIIARFNILESIPQLLLHRLDDDTLMLKTIADNDKLDELESWISYYNQLLATPNLGNAIVDHINGFILQLTKKHIALVSATLSKG